MGRPSLFLFFQSGSCRRPIPIIFIQATVATVTQRHNKENLLLKKTFEMFVVKISTIVLFAGFINCQQVESDNERPYLRILAPQFICNDKKATQTEQNNVTIGLQTREGQTLRYSILIDFEMLGSFKSQRHTLSIWKNIRLLQNKFHNITDDISSKNQLDISAQEV